MIYLAFCMAALVQSTLGPRVQKPCLSGGLTCIRATSKSIIFRWKSNGISLKKMGVKSARPSFTAFRQLPPMNRELLLKIPTTVTNFSLKKDFKKHDVYLHCTCLQNRKVLWLHITTTQGRTYGYMYSRGQVFGRVWRRTTHLPSSAHHCSIGSFRFFRVQRLYWSNKKECWSWMLFLQLLLFRCLHMHLSIITLMLHSTNARKTSNLPDTYK